ncbi:MAG: hypothetical protein GW808_06060 [Sphingomonadales bacterium]|nr:hypothetical protein [Sphingomonadales bacterium]PIX66458.1 MAG: hypothetical protein COZ43_06495 [Sphingomonadales bacterium CG_4_10_14_3_um_filter_58_15]NCO48703.1 hypothetical protein [Sphingomonadales bacterium]NCP00121.1 hypothetical protein [Sphingomonadales bacterium]NCP27905.1 hypothetical protein [Sphingomonadales bacterium]
MLMGKPDWLDRIAQLLVVGVGLFAVLFGLFMIIRPLDWYVSIPTVIATGPPNKHFIRDIGIAYAACGIMLLYASVNIHMRWLAAFAGALWLSLHGILHIYEVSVGICSPDAFIADAPGVLGPPLLVLLALGILFARQRVAPAGIPKRLLLRAATAGIEESEKQYLEEIAAAPGHAFEKFAHFMPASMHRHAAPAALLHAARMGANLVEDCGPCALTTAEWALFDNVPRETVNRWLKGTSDLPEEEALALQFGRAIGSQSIDAFELGDQIETRYGRAVRFELAMSAAMVRVYPAMKRGLGLTKACSLTPLAV